MAVESRWLKEGKIVHQRFYGSMTPADIQKATQDISQKAQKAKGRRLHFLVDVSEVNDVILPGAHEFQLDMQRIQPGWLVMIGEKYNRLSDMQNSMTGVALNHLWSHRSRNFNTLEEGKAFLEDISELLGD